MAVNIMKICYEEFTINGELMTMQYDKLNDVIYNIWLSRKL